MSGSILDLILILVFIACIARAWKKGFIKVGASILSSLSGFLIGAVVASGLGQALYDMMNIRAKLFDFISPRVSIMISDTSSKLTENAIHDLFAEMPVVGDYVYSNIVSSGKMDGVLNSVISIEQITNSILNLTKPVILMLIKVLIFIVVAFLTKLLLKGLFAIVFGIIFKVPLVSSLDSALGAVFGTISGAFWCVAIVIVLMVISVLVTNDFVTASTFNSSKIVSELLGLIGMK